METQRFTAFVSNKRVAAGALRDVLPVLKKRFDARESVLVLLFEDETGKQVDFDLRGSLAEVLERALPPAGERGPGRPRLGVVSREISLLPRHWDWLEAQPNGISAALRRLVDRARSVAPGAERARQVRAAVSRIMTALAGNLPGYEEAARALFAKDQPRFEKLVHAWPKDLRTYVIRLSRAAVRAEE